MCNNSNVDEIWLLTSSDISHYDGVDRCFSKVPINKTPEIYRSCDVLVKLSYVEGMFGPPLEMFHCGGTALVYDVTGYDEYIEQNKNSLVVKKDSEKDVIHHLNRMKNEPGLIERLQQGALETASEWPDWSEATLNLEKLLKKYTPQFDAIPSFLSSHSEYFMKNRENAFCAREISRLAEREHITAVHDKPFLNFVQVYYHCGEGFSNEKMRWQKYHSGDWVMCKVSLPCYADTMQIRVDPSVRVGIVQIRSLKVRDAKTGRKISEWRPHQSWDNIEIGGTAAILRKKPYPVLNCYGEDPQLILPTVKNNSDINVEIELREMSYSQALCRFSDLCENKKKMGIFQNLKYKLLGKN